MLWETEDIFPLRTQDHEEFSFNYFSWGQFNLFFRVRGRPFCAFPGLVFFGAPVGPPFDVLADFGGKFEHFLAAVGADGCGLLVLLVSVDGGAVEASELSYFVLRFWCLLANYLSIRHPRKQYAFQVFLREIIHHMVAYRTSILDSVNLRANPALPDWLSPLLPGEFGFFHNDPQYFGIIAAVKRCHRIFPSIGTTFLISQFGFFWWWF